MELETRSCTLCGPEAAKHIKYRENFSLEDLNATIFSARRSPDKRHFRLVTCGSCGIIYSDPACAPQKLEALYQDSQVHYTSQEDDIYASYVPVLDHAARLSPNRGAFVEVGGGRGFMLRYGAEHGYAEQIEIEPSRDAQAKFEAPSPNARFVCDIFRSGTIPANSASLVCFFQVLDHLPDPMQFVRDAFEVLEPGGVAVGVTHNTQALSARLLGERSPIFDIEHTYLFNRANLYKLFRQAGFSQVSTYGIGNCYTTRHWLHLLPSPPKVKARALSLLERARLADVRINLRAGNVAVVGVKPKD